MTIITHIEPPIATIQLHNPGTLNALNLATGQALLETLLSLDQHPSVNVVIIESGVEKAFSTGIDLKEFYLNDTPDYRQAFLDTWNQVASFSKPLIMSVHGYAFGGGFELALMGDIIIAADTAIFAQPELSVGTIPGLGATQRLARRIGLVRAAELILTGRRITADIANAWGIISQVVPAADLPRVTRDLANTIAAKSLPTLIAAKQALRQSEQLPLNEGLALEQRLFLETFELEDRREGFQAFLQKRPPEFKGR